MITHLEPDILECKVKWALGSITTNKASGGDGIPAELFQVVNDDAELIMRNTGLEKAQARIKTAWRNTNYLICTNDTPQWQKVKRN